MLTPSLTVVCKTDENYIIKLKVTFTGFSYTEFIHN